MPKNLAFALFFAPEKEIKDLAMCGCSTSEAQYKVPFRSNIGTVDRMSKALSSHKTFGALSQNPNVSSFVTELDGRVAVFVDAIESEDTGVFLTFQKGKLLGLKFKIIKFDINYPKADIEIRLEYAPLDEEVLIAGTIKVTCEDIGQPLGCKVTFTLDAGASRIADDAKMFYDWECLKNCAPGCISCGGNKWCWLSCAAQCVIRCW